METAIVMEVILLIGLAFWYYYGMPFPINVIVWLIVVYLFYYMTVHSQGYQQWISSGG
jgi:hypothetical protein